MLWSPGRNKCISVYYSGSASITMGFWRTSYNKRAVEQLAQANFMQSPSLVANGSSWSKSPPNMAKENFME